MRTIVYVDGFNLYFGSLRKRPWRWLNIDKAIRLHLAPFHRIEAIKYYSAKLNPRQGNPDQPARQALYLRALQTIPGLSIHLGHFLTKNVRMVIANPAPGGPTSIEVVKTEEKGSDVNLATHMVHDAHCGLCECAVVLSGDSDLLEPVRIVKNELRKVVGVLNPQKHPCAVLKREATFYKHLRPGLLSKSLFAECLVDSRGEFHKPAAW
jgi:uncharacterized LabA/DUF88 family protein